MTQWCLYVVCILWWSWSHSEFNP